MDNSSDSRQPGAAPNPVPATEDQVLPRGKLMVEVYVAEQLPPEPPHAARRGKGPRLTSRALAAFAVLGLHAAVGIWLWASSEMSPSTTAFKHNWSCPIGWFLSAC